jgi:hypothetical protein
MFLRRLLGHMDHDVQWLLSGFETMRSMQLRNHFMISSSIVVARPLCSCLWGKTQPEISQKSDRWAH